MGCSPQWPQWWGVEPTHLIGNFQRAWGASLPGLTALLWLVPFYTLFACMPIQPIRAHLALYKWADELWRHSFIRALLWEGRMSSRLTRNRLTRGSGHSHRPSSTTGPATVGKGTHSCHGLQDPRIQLQMGIYSCSCIQPLLQRSATFNLQTRCSETCESCDTSQRCNTPNSSHLASRCEWEFRPHHSICHSCLVTYFSLFKVINPKLIKFLSFIHPLLSAHFIIGKSKIRTQLDTGNWSLLTTSEGHCEISWWY